MSIAQPWRHDGRVKSQIGRNPLTLGDVRPTQGKKLAVMKVSGGPQSFNAVNRMLILGRGMRLIASPNRPSVVKAFMEFENHDRMKPSAYYERGVGPTE
ncbi:hypothetical protein [uncultured Rhodoblastus sp.]|uniref:hypothetical protein n=1 Tax=uncultured Rhodoblastus sp. TaxID=543037 RepID=UPI0025D6E640|nr:hypothetical protein [uncultured Rhodoblastus sp.]